MNTWKVILATLVIFGAGVITGGLLVSYSTGAWCPSAHTTPAADGQLPAADPQRVPVERKAAPVVRESKLPQALSGPLRKDFLNRLSHELKLSAEQRERIEKIVSEGQERTKELWRIERVETWHRIRKELTPEQQIRFEELFKSQPREQRRLPPPSDRFSTNSLPSDANSPANP